MLADRMKVGHPEMERPGVQLMESTAEDRQQGGGGENKV
jgi:hypothetical protein